MESCALGEVFTQLNEEEAQSPPSDSNDSDYVDDHAMEVPAIAGTESSVACRRAHEFFDEDEIIEAASSEVLISGVEPDEHQTSDRILSGDLKLPSSDFAGDGILEYEPSLVIMGGFRCSLCRISSQNVSAVFISYEHVCVES
ncbi:hypothetical protein GN958_ATG10022 [Phytophthora infestans]|nr:hypothetical protein GN958_ATG10022 [Phytophthora infestans]